MKIALISDIHSNLEALTSVIKQIEKLHIDEIYCLGDVIGYGCEPSACLDIIDKVASVKLMGNHEAVLLGLISTESYTETARISSNWTKSNLSDKDLAIISTFKMTYSTEDMLLVHASPFEPEKWHYILTPGEASLAFDKLNKPLCFYGHTHVPIIFSEVPNDLPHKKTAHNFDPDEESRYLVNVGSVGQPRDNDPRACFATYDTEFKEVCFYRNEYDISTVQAKMTEAELPDLLIERLAVGR